MTEPAHITRAKALLAEAESGTGAHDKPMGVITISDIMDAERRLTQAQLEVRAFTQGTDGMRETVDRAGIKGVVDWSGGCAEIGDEEHDRPLEGLDAFDGFAEAADDGG